MKSWTDRASSSPWLFYSPEYLRTLVRMFGGIFQNICHHSPKYLRTFPDCLATFTRMFSNIPLKAFEPCACRKSRVLRPLIFNIITPDMLYCYIYVIAEIFLFLLCYHYPSNDLKVSCKEAIQRQSAEMFYKKSCS